MGFYVSGWSTYVGVKQRPTRSDLGVRRGYWRMSVTRTPVEIASMSAVYHLPNVLLNQISVEPEFESYKSDEHSALGRS